MASAVTCAERVTSYPSFSVVSAHCPPTPSLFETGHHIRRCGSGCNSSSGNVFALQHAAVDAVDHCSKRFTTSGGRQIIRMYEAAREHSGHIVEAKQSNHIQEPAVTCNTLVPAASRTEIPTSEARFGTKSRCQEFVAQDHGKVNSLVMDIQY